jgi:hypothetical protein
MSADTRIRVVLYTQGSVWIAQALEYDITTQHKTINGSIKRMLDTIVDTYKITLEEFGEPFAGIKPAPVRFHEMFDGAEDDFDFEVTPRMEEHPERRALPPITTRLLEDCAAA